ncbi:MAG: YraN family protein [Oscillospiraceae bacterium]|nr:YraN family protein [Oscillospiraceae bacterium]
MSERGGAAARVLGNWGEGIALKYLEGKGYSKVAQGFRSRFGEVDIIARNKEFIVFVEVKLRKNANFAYAREYVGKAKQRKIKMTANIWLASNRPALQPRFDVIEIYAPHGEATASPGIEHIENAF